MSGEVIKEFLVGLGFKVDEAGMQSFTAALGGATVQAAALGAATAAAAGAVFAAVQHIAGEYFELDKLAMRFRSTAEEIDAFTDAGTVLGLSSEQTIGSLKALDKNIGDTALGIGRAKAVFAEIGQEVLDSAGKMRPTTVVMQELAEKFKDMERGKALAIMDRLGLDPALLKLFNADLATLGKDIRDIEQAAGFDLADAIEESKAFTVSWRLFSQEIEKAKMLFAKMIDVIAVRLMPRFRASVDTLTKQFKSFRLMVMGNMGQIRGVIEGAVNVLLRVVEFVSLSAYRLIQVVSYIVNGIIDLFGKLDGTTQLVVLGIAAITAAWKFMNLSFLATPLGRILLLVAAIGLLIDDFLVWKEGGKSLINWGSTFGTTLAVVTGVVGALTAAMLVQKGVMLAYGAAVAFVNGVMASARVAVVAFNLVMAANPMSLTIVAVLAGLALLSLGVASLIDNWTTVKAYLMGFFTWLSGKFTEASTWAAGLIPDWMKNMGGAMGSLASAVGGPMLSPSPQAAASMTGGTQTVSQSTEIIVQGATNPEATARLVVREQGRVNADLARNTRGVTR